MYRDEQKEPNYDHENTDVRIAANFSKDAATAFRAGDVEKGLSAARLAGEFANDVVVHNGKLIDISDRPGLTKPEYIHGLRELCLCAAGAADAAPVPWLSDADGAKHRAAFERVARLMGLSDDWLETLK